MPIYKRRRRYNEPRCFDAYRGFSIVGLPAEETLLSAQAIGGFGWYDQSVASIAALPKRACIEYTGKHFVRVRFRCVRSSMSSLRKRIDNFHNSIGVEASRLLDASIAAYLDYTYVDRAFVSKLLHDDRRGFGRATLDLRPGWVGELPAIESGQRRWCIPQLGANWSPDPQGCFVRAKSEKDKIDWLHEFTSWLVQADAITTVLEHEARELVRRCVAGEVKSTSFVVEFARLCKGGRGEEGTWVLGRVLHLLESGASPNDGLRAELSSILRETGDPYGALEFTDYLETATPRKARIDRVAAAAVRATRAAALADIFKFEQAYLWAEAAQDLNPSESVAKVFAHINAIRAKVGR